MGNRASYHYAVSEKSQNQGISSQLLIQLMKKATIDNFSKVFALSKHNSKWFLKHGFVQMDICELPKKRQDLFDYQRNSSIFFKKVEKHEN
ncbi:MAG: hypothetical protein RPU59_08810 [Candidatus Sedimenticola sp. (ex Thyasira tokunagai)]